MFKSLTQLGLGARLALGFALLAATTAFVTAGVSTFSTSRQVNADIDSFLSERSLDISEGRRGDPGDAGRAGRGVRPRGGVVVTREEIRALVDSDAEVQVLSPAGEVVRWSGVVLPVEDADLSFLGRTKAPKLRTVEVEGESFRLITRSLENGGAVQVARSLNSTDALLGDLRNELLLVGLLMSSIAALVGWGIAQGTTRPLRRLTEKVETVTATQDLTTSLRLDRSDEIGRLSEEFDSLLKTLGASRDQQQRLVQDAAHELRTPLTSVRANIDFLDRAVDLDPADRQATLASIKAELSELSGVLAEVVELATEARGAASFETVDLAGVAETALTQFELRSSRTVIRDITASLVVGDANALSRAAGNLLANADKYTPQDAPITLVVADGSLSVVDHGPGIAEEERTLVFERFYRSDRDRAAPGSGLGLAIVDKAAREHGGRPWVRQTPGGGATVGFTLPTV